MGKTLQKPGSYVGKIDIIIIKKKSKQRER